MGFNNQVLAYVFTMVLSMVAMTIEGHRIPGRVLKKSDCAAKGKTFLSTKNLSKCFKKKAECEEKQTELGNSIDICSCAFGSAPFMEDTNKCIKKCTKNAKKNIRPAVSEEDCEQFCLNALFWYDGSGSKGLLAQAGCMGIGWYPSLVCERVNKAPTLDGDFKDWKQYKSTEEVQLPLINMAYESYEHGDLSARCVYDSDSIYFAFEVPGLIRFNKQENTKCASIGTMFKIGKDATYDNMGGCPDAVSGCDENGEVPETCETYTVDLGAHWELKATEQGVTYELGRNSTSDGTGNDDPINLDDEYAVSPTCRPDDMGENAGNEWAGAWRHDNVKDLYFFELSRLLRTDSAVTDVQLKASQTYSFGVAFWDPWETKKNGWTKSGHYYTGNGQWMDLVLD